VFTTRNGIYEHSLIARSLGTWENHSMKDDQEVLRKMQHSGGCISVSLFCLFELNRVTDLQLFILLE